MFSPHQKASVLCWCNVPLREVFKVILTYTSLPKLLPLSYVTRKHFLYLPFQSHRKLILPSNSTNADN